jgi:hypothetical protein
VDVLAAIDVCRIPTDPRFVAAAKRPTVPFDWRPEVALSDKLYFKLLQFDALFTCAIKSSADFAAL